MCAALDVFHTDVQEHEKQLLAAGCEGELPAAASVAIPIAVLLGMPALLPVWRVVNGQVLRLVTVVGSELEQKQTSAVVFYEVGSVWRQDLPRRQHHPAVYQVVW